jgi:LCP family protein required for cell wall assembly
VLAGTDRSPDLDGAFGEPVYAVSDGHPSAELFDRPDVGSDPGHGRVPPRRKAGAHRAPRGRRLLSGLLRRALLAAAAFTALLVASSVGVAAYAYNHYNGQIKRVAVLQTRDTNVREAAKQLNAQNFLVIGSDSRAGADSQYGNVAGARSDTTILVHLSPDRSKATVISFPRDSWVQIPSCVDRPGHTVGEHTDLFNAAFSVGGASCTISLVQRMTGIKITHFVQVDFSGFKSMVNALGSVSICSPTAVSDSNSGLVLHPGVNKLSGDQALAYVRARESIGDGSDLGRIRRQQLFLGAVMRQAMSGSLLSNPARLTSFLDAATKAVTVDKDTTFSDLRSLASSLQGLDPARVTMYTAPIANPDYSPPGTDMTGKVLLDTTKGRVLYDSVINDQTKVVQPTSSTHPGTSAPGSSPKPATGSASKSAPPVPSSVSTGITAADKSCSL